MDAVKELLNKELLLFQGSRTYATDAKQNLDYCYILRASAVNLKFLSYFEGDR